MRTATLQRLLQARADKEPVALVTDLTTGLQTLVFPDRVEGGFGLSPAHLEAVRDRIGDDASGLIEEEDADGGMARRLFVQVHNPPLRLILVGAVHITQHLAPMAAMLGYGVTVVDPRGAFASEGRFPGVTLDTRWPDDALSALTIDARTAVVTLTHDAKLDDPALLVALRSPAFYVGSLGSTRTHAKRLDRLRVQGLRDRQLARLHAPVGLDIGAVSPAEIALSVLAEITAVRRNGRILLTRG